MSTATIRILNLYGQKWIHLGGFSDYYSTNILISLSMFVDMYNNYRCAGGQPIRVLNLFGNKWVFLDGFNDNYKTNLLISFECLMVCTIIIDVQ